MSMLNNQVSITELEKTQIDTVYEREKENLTKRDKLIKSNDVKVVAEVKDQCKFVQDN
jgi:hypothetical protein